MKTLKIKYARVNRSKLLVDRRVMNELIKRVRRYEKIDVIEETAEPRTKGIMRLAEQGKSLRFLYNKKQDIYSVADVKIKYK